MLSLPFWACTGYTALYVGSIYVFPRICRWIWRAQHPVTRRPRNDPDEIRERLWSVSASSVANLACTAFIVQKSGYVTSKVRVCLTQGIVAAAETLRYMGLPVFMPTWLTSNALPFTPDLFSYVCDLLAWVGGTLALTGLAYLGTFYSDYLEEALPGQRFFQPPASRLEVARNFGVGPTSEELVFRSCMLATARFGSASPSQLKLLFTTPLYFGLAHLHHAIDVYYQGGKTHAAFQNACLSAAVQFAYTTVFGWYADYLFLRTGTCSAYTGTVIAPLAAHILCNAMGLPRLPRRGTTPQRLLGMYVPAGLTMKLPYFTSPARPPLSTPCPI